jgi:hypothetical protein
MDVPVLIPDSVPQGETKLQVRLHFANGVRVSPDTGFLELTLAPSPLAVLLRSGTRIALFVVVLILGLSALLGIVIMLRRMPKRAEAPIAAAVLQAEATSSAKAALGAAAASSSMSERARSVSTAESSAAIAASLREESARSASLLAEAAREAKAGSRADISPAAARASRGHNVFKLKLKPEARDAAIDSSAAALVAQNKAESKRRIAVLAEASGRRAPAVRLSKTAEAKARAQAAAYAPRVVKPGSLQIELLVSNQNPHIGSRNVHILAAGGSKSVGGGSSDFLVFLVSVPRKSAEIHFDGEKLAFVPLRQELFPELTGPVEDCLGVDIPMISRAGYPLTLRFAQYEKPADIINRLLHCIETPGL